MTLVDTHCHLNDRRAFPDPVQVVDEALSQGVARLVVVGVDTESSERAVDLADRFDPIYAVVGWHPNSASEFNPSEMKRIEGLLGHPKVVALGEIGLDYYRDHASRED
ncbi:MAG: TatD family hydrolase, partial [Chthonomonadaceae bacterium]|nr:TatD family hydrolase [Chthonomonadaceae bacterium]